MEKKFFFRIIEPQDLLYLHNVFVQQIVHKRINKYLVQNYKSKYLIYICSETLYKRLEYLYILLNNPRKEKKCEEEQKKTLIKSCFFLCINFQAQL